MIGWIDRFLSRFTERAIERSAVVVTLLLGGVHYFLPPGLPFFLFYLGPVAAASWYANRSGYFVAFLGAATWTFASYPDLSHPASAWGLAWSAGVTLGTFMVVAVLTIRLRQAVELRRDAARKDFLTGLTNARAFREGLAEEIHRALRYGGVYTVAYLDLDRFKELNDSRGHAEGDEVLRQVARVMNEATRSTDTAARLGGDEFALLLPETPFAQAETALTKLRNRITEAMEEGRWPVSVSVGAVTFEASANSADQALRLTDDLMYEVKVEGGDGLRHVLWTGEEVADPGPPDSP